MQDVGALLFGATIIMFFSYERFNRATYDGGQQLKRLVDLLSPDKLRARRVVLNAYLFYALTLVVIYLLFCVYAKLLPVLGGPNLFSAEIGANKLPSGSSETASNLVGGFNKALELWTASLSDPSVAAVPKFDIGIPPTVSLTIALIMVGLAPSFPVLQRFEDWLRGAAHRLAGIPTHVIGIGEDLRRNDVGILADKDSVKGSNLLIATGNWDRMKKYESAAEKELTAPDFFKRDLQIIFAICSWILERRLKLRNSKERQRFERLEEELHRRTNDLIQQLDERAGYRLGISSEKTPNESEDEVTERERASWERLAENADDLADDLCILLALYVEHEIIVMDGASTGKPSLQQDLAFARLKNFLGNLSAPTHVRSYAMVSLAWTVSVTLVIFLLWSLVPGKYETALQVGNSGDVYRRALTYMFNATISYGMPAVVALALRDGGLQARRWQRIWSHWTLRMPQTAIVFFVSWAVATLFLVGLELWKIAVTQGSGADEVSIWWSLRTSFEYNAPITARGALLAMLIIRLLDVKLEIERAPSAVDPPSSFFVGIRAALLMAVCGAVTRYANAWSAAINAIQPRPGLDSIDWGLIVYSALSSAIVGFIVIFCIAETVFRHDRKADATTDTETGAARSRFLQAFLRRQILPWRRAP
ncbi:hypothetical protein ACC755_09685 [Rhizobium ruizarguesonis]|uniref:hypothetical protein n=1 Tax=Rhizobium ruizarguesonis TaxID=2081791 RepID=UPI00102F523B|nr:hypothetical protein [Rhizobium ruizarguesonis]TAY93135.1 hypothetical protein ELH85_08090 [Rhizobium ruizarguesonis]